VSAGADEVRQLVVFRVGQEEYGVDIRRVQEIIRYTAPRPIPGAPPDMEGVINLRGRIIPVIGLAGRLGMFGGERPESAKIVVVELTEHTVGVVVDEVTEVMGVAADALEAPPHTATADYLEAVVRLEGRLLVLLDLPRLFGELEAVPA
jgi:purine-binding chemotaxis protein CheW